MMDAKYVIGIDLGTTNCTMAYATIEPSQLPLEIIQFPIPQFTELGTQEAHHSFPSFLLFPLEEERTASDAFYLGAFAKKRGAELPDRLIHSAKSWLCHDGIDQREPFLPLLSDESEKKMSPVEVCAAFLRHLKNAWDAQFSEHHFSKQKVLITVPASFDPCARQLVLEAALNAHYPEITLLEEPLAAFYAWLYKKGEQWRKQLKVNDRVLIIDIGGGTTDFTMIAVEETLGNLELQRQAVGEHLLLGGDNIDLALAHIIKESFETQGHQIDDWQLQNLVHSCRNAKESLLTDDLKRTVDITVLGRGSRLIGGTLSTSISSETMCDLILKGFAPHVPFSEKVVCNVSSGISQISLPYAKDPRITSQMAKFLRLSLEGSQEGNFPTAVLFNGGTMKSTILRKQIMQQLNEWAKEFHGQKIKELTDPEYDYAVSCGGAYYGLTQQGQGIRIKAGASHSYFVGIEGAAPAVPGLPPSLKALCLVPFGMEEGTFKELPNQQFSLILGEQAIFRFFSRSSPMLSNGLKASIGTVINNWKSELIELNPLQANLEKKEGDGKTIRVRLASKVTELGILELWCLSDDGRKWKLEFDTRVTSSKH